jgi:hypothetical protein
VAEHPDVGDRVPRAGGRGAQAEPAPHEVHRAQRHGAGGAAQLGLPAGRCHQPLLQPVVRADRRPGAVQAARPHRRRLPRPRELGPGPAQRASGRLRGRPAAATSTRASGPIRTRPTAIRTVRRP